MSTTEAPKLELDAPQTVTEPQQQQTTTKPLNSETEQTKPTVETHQQQQTQDTPSEADPKEAAAADSDVPKEKKPNPLKKVLAVFKAVFGCLRKPAVKEEGEVKKEGEGEEVKKAEGEQQQAGEAVVEEKTAPAAAGEKNAEGVKEGKEGVSA